MLDFVLYILFRSWVGVMRLLPLEAWLAAARLAADIYRVLDGRRRRRAAIHIKMAFPDKTFLERKRILVAMYRNFAQNIVETLYLPYMDAAFMRRHVAISGWGIFQEAEAKGKGVVFLGCHAGSWELSNIACAFLIGSGRYAMLARPQGKTKKIDAFLNDLRTSKGCGVIRVNELKKMVEHLSQNKVLGSVADHGGREGVLVPFFGKTAKTPTGTVKLAKKLGAPVILAFMHRRRGAEHEMFLEAFHPSSGASDEKSLAADLAAINAVFEKWIRLYPEEYLWFYRRWKYSSQRRVLILSDGKAGHVKQSQALAGMVRDLGFETEIRTTEVRFKTRTASTALAVIARILGAGAARTCLRFFLEGRTYDDISREVFDLVVSAGSSLAAVNIAVAHENDAASVAIMKPGLLRYGQLDLVVMPEHDRPPKKKNVAVIVGSLNSVSAESMKKDYEMLLSRRSQMAAAGRAGSPKIGLLVGGDSRHYVIREPVADILVAQLRRILEETGAYLFVTTSRRTAGPVVRILREAFASQDNCKLFVDAAQDNPPGTVGGILCASDILVVSGESISMVSEAVASAKPVVVFEPQRLTERNKVRRFLEKMQADGRIYLVKTPGIYDKLSWIIGTKPVAAKLDTRTGVIEALKKLI
ncbi:lipid A biosynthesis lauroyl acyltransferase [Candidatus Velamenicoccus archaeovorus]|uniref:Lipid A biosynthesis lauroyl acyltransferase n=1 Tax=Velamenicoccus archaeovorus TaxID=1930593 RepID=A0A410P2N5_VELA1|nr:ELM1/GtrOC1 family putative glycosyltransferase [Candidatus Velamenicoccus archaeovorus]QAT16403.1 lipid A biosynthesis lauroyl acyltransferase [Candidatus Velamenicoccus archaeovorus]